MQLAPKAVVVQVWRSAISWGVLVAVVAGLLIFPALRSPIVFVIVGALACFIVVELAWIAPSTVRVFRYSVDSDGIRTSGGILFKRSNFAPMQQILVVERRQGPIMRAFGLVKVRLRLPGSYVDIDGVSDEDFLRVQEEFKTALNLGSHD